MDLLSKIEDGYLFILRVFVLGLATLALLCGAYGLFRAAPILGSMLGPQASEVKSGRKYLAGFVDEKRKEGQTTVADSAPGQPQTFIPPDIKAAAEDLRSYEKARLNKDLSIGDAEQPFMRYYDDENLNEVNKDRYARSAHELMDQLKASKGKPLSLDNIDNLILWHAQKFVRDIATEEAKAANQQNEFLKQAALVGSAFAAFLGVIFFFLIVKIERNLRLIRIRWPNLAGAK
jgi:hypothetical protein